MERKPHGLCTCLGGALCSAHGSARWGMSALFPVVSCEYKSTYVLEGYPGSRDPRPMPADRAAAFTSVSFQKLVSDSSLGLVSLECLIEVELV